METMEQKVGQQKLRLESGKLAKQALGSVLASYGGTVVLSAVTAEEKPIVGRDFLPLTVEYREKTYAVGKIPGGFFKREGRPREKETVTARLIDRSVRPLFPKEFRNEIQVVATVFSCDQENDPDIVAIIASSCALALSGLPFANLVGAVRIGYAAGPVKNRVSNGAGQFIVNPTFQQLETSELDLVIAGTKSDILMLEGSAREVGDEIIMQALQIGQGVIKEVIEIEEELITKIGSKKFTFTLSKINEELGQQVRNFSQEKIKHGLEIPEKSARAKILREITQDVLAKFLPDYPEAEGNIIELLEEIQRAEVRKMILTQNLRVDGRTPEEIRPISCEVGILPRTHGSALFTRGQTQALACTTLGTIFDQQVMEELKGRYKKEFMLHYNFPPFSTGEVGSFRGPGRREIGHGYLAEKALKVVLPSSEQFPYTIQIVSEILESNGSSSMATVCAGSLSLMDAGVPITRPVAGIALGLVKEDNGDGTLKNAQPKEILLSDISGIEDHCGDMDLKVAGTRKGVTTIQMDLKRKGVGLEVLQKAFQRAREGRFSVLEKMDAVIANPRTNISPYAPYIRLLHVQPDKIGEIIGPGGKSIRKIIETTGADIEVGDEGEVCISGKTMQVVEETERIIRGLSGKIEKGMVYKGKVVRIAPFGAFVELFPGKDGLVHISELTDKYVSRVEDVVKVGDEVTVKVLKIDDQGKVSLSMKDAGK